MGSNPFRVIPLLGDSSLCRGNIFFRYRERSRRRLILEADFEESRVVALMVFGITCIRIVILICVCSKRNVITLELLENSWVYILMSISLWAKEANFYSGMGLAIRDV